jgi:outer membrane receptor protein involved in Fe transport
MAVKKFGFLATAAALASTSTGALAQNDSAQQAPQAQSARSAAADADSEEIVVTANRREQNLSNVGMSLATFGQEQLTQRIVTNVSDVAKLVPGLSVTSSTNGAPVYSLRGVGINESTIGSTGSVAVYQDQVPLALPIESSGPALDIERLEVLKGPQGTLYGQNATAGLINFIAAKPTSDFQAGINASYGRFDTASVEGYISGPLGSAIKGRLALRTIQSGDWQKSISRPGDTLGEQHRYAGRLILDIEPSSNFKVRLNLNGWRDKSDTVAVQMIALGPAAPDLVFPEVLRAPIAPNKARYADWDANLPVGYRPEQTNPLKHNDYFWQGSATAELGITDNINFTSITAYSRYKTDADYDIDGMGTDAITHADVVTTRQTIDSKAKHFYQEGRFSGNVGKATWSFGANYSHDKIDEFFIQHFRHLSNTAATGVRGGGALDIQNVRAFAIFGSAEVPVTDTVTLSGGIRYAEEKRKFTGCTTDYGDGTTTAFFVGVLANLQRSAAGLPAIPAVAGEFGCVTVNADLLPGAARITLKEHNVPWNVNVNWKPTSKVLVYGRVSRGFKSGNFPAQTAANNTAYKPVVQEELTAYEIGTRLTLSPAVRIEAAGFIYDYKNKQQRGRIDCACIFGLVTSQINVPKAQIKGIEGSVVVRPIEGLSLAASGTYLDSKVKKYVGFNSDGLFLDQAGFPLNYTPKYSANVDVNYTIPLNDSLDVFVGGNLSYRSKTTGDIAGSDLYRIKAYTLIDAQLGVESSDKRWKAWIFGNNITNKYYWTNVVHPGDTIVRWAGMPATYGAAISFKYK